MSNQELDLKTNKINILEKNAIKMIIWNNKLNYHIYTI